MQAIAVKLNNLLKDLDEEDYDKVVSYVEFLVSRRKKQISDRKFTEDRGDVEDIVRSLTGAIPDMGKSLEEYRKERLEKYGYSD